MARLELDQREDGWWITDPEGELDDRVWGTSAAVPPWGAPDNTVGS